MPVRLSNSRRRFLATPIKLSTPSASTGEGVVAKRVSSLYEPGKRSGSWVKLPCKQAGKFVIGGFRPAGKGFSVLLLGRFDSDGDFRFSGKLRHGFDGISRQAVFDAIMRLRTLSCAFDDLPNCRADGFDENVTPEEMDSFIWVRPEVELAVKYSERTRLGNLRHPEFAGERLG